MPNIRWVWAVIGLFIIGLQFRLWVGEGSFAQVSELRTQIKHQMHENALLAERNGKLMAEVIDLKSGLQAIEGRARHQLGMIGENETFFWVVSE